MLNYFTCVNIKKNQRTSRAVGISDGRSFGRVFSDHLGNLNEINGILCHLDIEELVHDFRGSSVDFLILYIPEAHSTDGWHLFKENATLNDSTFKLIKSEF